MSVVKGKNVRSMWRSATVKAKKWWRWRSRRGWGLRLFIVSGLVLVLSACGGGSTPAPPKQQGQSQQQPSEEGRIIEIASGEFYFDPADITVKRGETVTLVVPNDGAVAHNISIDAFGIDETYGVGQTARVTFTPDKTGTFEIYCDEPGHTPAGMVGTLTVVP